MKAAAVIGPILRASIGVLIMPTPANPPFDKPRMITAMVAST